MSIRSLRIHFSLYHFSRTFFLSYVKVFFLSIIFFYHDAVRNCISSIFFFYLCGWYSRHNVFVGTCMCVRMCEGACIRVPTLHAMCNVCGVCGVFACVCVCGIFFYSCLFLVSYMLCVFIFQCVPLRD
jgi:hypothetical protein